MIYIKLMGFIVIVEVFNVRKDNDLYKIYRIYQLLFTTV